MLDGLYVDERFFWLIPFAFYVVDNIKTIGERDLILYEVGTLRWRVKLDRTPFLVRGRHLYVLPLFAPYAAALKLPWFHAKGRTRDGVDAFRLRLSEWCATAAGLRVIGACSFLLQFAAAPALTIWLGLFNTLLTVLPLHLMLVAAAAILLCVRRRALGLGGWQAAGAIAELVLVPGFLPNVCRRTAWATLSQDVDGVAVARSVVEPEAFSVLAGTVRYRLSEDWIGTDAATRDDAVIAAYCRELDL